VRKLSFVALVLMTLLAPRASQACSMCRCGDPTFALTGTQVFSAQAWHVGLDFGRFAKDQVSLEDPLTREEEVEDRVTLTVSRNFAGRLTLVARLPFANREITTVDEQNSMSGLSDPELQAHYRLYSPGPGSGVAVSLGLRPGWGKNDGQLDGERAEEHLQPGTGSAGAEVGLSAWRTVGANDEGWLFSSAGGRFNGRNDAGYHYGDAVLANLGYERKLGGRVNAVLEANFRYAAKDEPVMGEEDPNTGGSVLYLSPRVVVKLDPRVSFRVGAQLPVLKDLYGDQDEKVNILTGLTFRF
jgi:hypothetical protein